MRSKLLRNFPRAGYIIFLPKSSISTSASAPNSALFWLRKETLLDEKRAPLAPQDAKMLIKKGAKVVVEECSQRIFTTESYAKAGCEIERAGSWINAPYYAYILGLKEIPDAIFDQEYAIKNYHAYFAHAYKGQAHAKTILDRFIKGGGINLDLEYLVDDKGKRVAAFGFYAGCATTALAINIWCQKQLGKEPPFKIPSYYESKAELISDLKKLLAQVEKFPNILVIGKNGRSGRGALELAQELKIEASGWGRDETRNASVTGIDEIANYDIFLNCVFNDKVINPFVTKETLQQKDRKLSVIGDVTCDFGAKNMIKIAGYETSTSFENPTWQYQDLDIMAIDHTPTLLPLESSTEFSKALVKYLSVLPPNPADILKNHNQDPLIKVWLRAIEKFYEVSSKIGLIKPSSVFKPKRAESVEKKEQNEKL
ncbi:MAG: hypothetical protein SFV53_00620 [Rickettsiales bacterium]|nr:hypothetical protein [Rickettsiales bacterium]